MFRKYGLRSRHALTWSLSASISSSVVFQLAPRIRSWIYQVMKGRRNTYLSMAFARSVCVPRSACRRLYAECRRQRIDRSDGSRPVRRCARVSRDKTRGKHSKFRYASSIQRAFDDRVVDTTYPDTDATVAIDDSVLIFRVVQCLQRLGLHGDFYGAAVTAAMILYST